jgi:hypothetical protein
MEALEMHLFELIGYCPLENNNSQAYSYMQDLGIQTQYLGYELLANVDHLPGTEEIAELSHELLIRYGILSSKEAQEGQYLEELIDCVEGYITRSIVSNGDQVRMFDASYFQSLIGNNKYVRLNLDQIINYYHTATKTTEEPKYEQSILHRKIEYTSYMLLIAVQTAILDSFSISAEEHLSFRSLPSGQTDKRIIFTRCFDPLKYKVDYGQSWRGKPETNYDKWLTEKVIPIDIVRAPFPKESQTLLNINSFKELSNDIFTLLQNPQDLLENSKNLISSNSNIDFKKSFGAVICLLLVWKDGLSYFAWFPLFGDLFSMLGNTGIGRLVGVFGLFYLSQEFEFKFSTKMFFQRENLMITLVIIGILLGTILTI